MRHRVTLSLLLGAAALAGCGPDEVSSPTASTPDAAETKGDRKLEALVRSRRSPYLCKIERGGDFSLDVEMISACGYLEEDGVACSLHGRARPDGRPAKPDLCTEWPPKNRGLHPGCVFGPRRRRSRPSGD